jgi:hypothetical protein
VKKLDSEPFIIASAILDFNIRAADFIRLTGMPLPEGKLTPTKKHIEQLRHFAKQGVKVRLK